MKQNEKQTKQFGSFQSVNNIEVCNRNHLIELLIASQQLIFVIKYVTLFGPFSSLRYKTFAIPLIIIPRQIIYESIPIEGVVLKNTVAKSSNTRHFYFEFDLVDIILHN